MKEVTTGKRYSKQTSVTYELPKDARALLESLQGSARADFGSGRKRIERLAEFGAAVLRDRGLPDVPYVWLTGPDEIHTEKPDHIPIVPGAGGGRIDKYVHRQYEHDSKEGLAASILRRADEVLQRIDTSPWKAVSAAIELGKVLKLWEVEHVDEKQRRKAQKSGAEANKTKADERKKKLRRHAVEFFQKRQKGTYEQCIHWLKNENAFTRRDAERYDALYAVIKGTKKEAKARQKM